LGFLKLHINVMHLGVKKVFHFKFIKKPLVRDLKDFNLFRLEPSVFQRFNKYLKLSNTMSWPLARAMKYLRSGKRLPASCRLSCEISRELGGSSAVCSLRFGQTLLSCSKAGGIYIYSTDSQLRSRSSSCFGQQTR